MARVIDYEKKIAVVQEKIEKKEMELDNLKDELAELEAGFEKQQNKELIDFMSETDISATEAVEIIKKALENRNQEGQ